MRDLGVYFLFAVVLVPALSARQAEPRRMPVWAIHSGSSFEQWLLGDALASLVVTPILFYWVLRPPNPATFSRVRVIEAVVLAHRAADQPEIRLRSRRRIRATSPRPATTRQCRSWSGRRSASACSARPRRRRRCRCSPSSCDRRHGVLCARRLRRRCRVSCSTSCCYASRRSTWRRCSSSNGIASTTRCARVNSVSATLPTVVRP